MAQLFKVKLELTVDAPEELTKIIVEAAELIIEELKTEDVLVEEPKDVQ